jgi:hypothetical protein
MKEAGTAGFSPRKASALPIASGAEAPRGLKSAVRQHEGSQEGVSLSKLFRFPVVNRDSFCRVSEPDHLLTRVAQNRRPASAATYRAATVRESVSDFSASSFRCAGRPLGRPLLATLALRRHTNVDRSLRSWLAERTGSPATSRDHRERLALTFHAGSDARGPDIFFFRIKLTPRTGVARSGDTARRSACATTGLLAPPEDVGGPEG